MTTITERVAAGAAFLDEHDPEWWRADVERAIDLDTLDLAEGDVCILGQRCPLAANDQYIAYGVMLSGLQETFAVDHWAVQYGFQADDSAEYDDLTAEWRKVITGRRAAS
jgi:hypothetical protein